LGGREPHNTVTDRRPAERAFLQPLGDEHKTGAVPQQQLHAIGESCDIVRLSLRIPAALASYHLAEPGNFADAARRFAARLS